MSLASEVSSKLTWTDNRLNIFCGDGLSNVIQLISENTNWKSCIQSISTWNYAFLINCQNNKECRGKRRNQTNLQSFNNSSNTRKDSRRKDGFGVKSF